MEKGIEEICFEDPEQVQCPKEDCEVRGKYFKCYFDKNYETCGLYNHKLNRRENEKFG